jgi:hypothetical protein
MMGRIRSLVWASAATFALAGLAGCSGAAGYTQTPDQMTPKVDIVAGDNQSTPVNTAFTTPMKIRFEKNGLILSGHLITFSAPESGAGGTFQDNSTNAMVMTDDNGYAVAPVFTANATKGSYTVLAWSASYQNTFHLTNQ